MNFSESIGLNNAWPSCLQDGQDGMYIKGKLKWAEAYYDAAELVCGTFERSSSAHFAGPMMQTLGMSTELTLKALLSGHGKTDKELRSLGHHTYKAYLQARLVFDEVKFVSLVAENSLQLEFPSELSERFQEEEIREVERSWRCYFGQLNLLDEMYDRPFRTRYMSPGPISLPEPTIILIGNQILNRAMSERLA